MSEDLRSHDKVPIRDLPDFVLRWQEFRPSAVGLLNSGTLRPEEKSVLAWLVNMADKITLRDVQG